MSCLLPRSRAGRPKDPAKRGAIVAAGMQLFTKHPFDMVTMEMIATQASVSKMTVYSHFADKETLFETIAISVSDRMIAAIVNTDHHDMPLYERLIATGIGFLTILMGPDVMGLSQMLPTALRSSHSLALRFYEAGPGRVKPVLAALLSEAASKGLLHIDDAHLAAEDLFALWEGGMRAELGCGLSGPITAEQIASRVKRGTQVFLRAYAVSVHRENPQFQ